MFIGRAEELRTLERLAGREKAALVVCRGRRRIGKSTLVQQFGATYPRFLEFQGLAPRPELTNADQLDNFSRMLARQTGLPAVGLDNWHDALSLLAKETERGRVVILLDEISWMGSRDPDFLGQLKIAWDTRFKKNPGLVLVLCGSACSWIDENILRSADFMGRVSLTLTVDELPLAVCSEFWGRRKRRVSGFEKFRILSITGGVPRYLEEIDPSRSAEQNIKSLCFEPSGILFQEFDRIFSDTFSRRAPLYRRIVAAMVEGPANFMRVCRSLKVDPNGVVTQYLADLEASGFIARDHVHDLATGRKGKLSRYRLKDNYLRFYLRYIEPEREKIQKSLYRFRSVENLKGYETIMGFQLENLALNNLGLILDELEIPPDSIQSASPYFQNRTNRQEACQVDLLIRARHAAYVCEIKYRPQIDASVIDEVGARIDRLKFPRRVSIRPVLIHVGEVAPAVRNEGFFDRVLSLEKHLT